MFLHPLPAFGRSVNCRGPTKTSAMEILQYGPTGSHALENAYDQYGIALLWPKSHKQLLQDVIDLGTSKRHHFGQETEVFVGRLKNKATEFS